MKTTTLKLLITLFALISLFTLTSCGKDGEPGKAYVRVVQTDGTGSYWDDNSGMPYGFYYEQYYECQEGTYNYRYYLSDGAQWYGTYSVFVNEGEEGGIFADGENGADTYKTLTMTWSSGLISSGGYKHGGYEITTTGTLSANGCDTLKSKAK